MSTKESLPADLQEELEEIQTIDEARKRLELADARYGDVEDELLELEEEKSNLQTFCGALEDRIAELEALELDPAFQEEQAYRTALSHPGQQKLDFSEGDPS